MLLSDLCGYVVKTYNKIYEGGSYMTIVVKKVPKFLRGIVKLIFGIKDNT